MQIPLNVPNILDIVEIYWSWSLSHNRCLFTQHIVRLNVIREDVFATMLWTENVFGKTIFFSFLQGEIWQAVCCGNKDYIEVDVLLCADPVGVVVSY